MDGIRVTQPPANSATCHYCTSAGTWRVVGLTAKDETHRWTPCNDHLQRLLTDLGGLLANQHRVDQYEAAHGPTGNDR